MSSFWMKKYVHTKNAVFNIGYHITFCPKYRKPFLHKLDIQLMRRTFMIAAIKVRGVIENIEIMPDHIHIFIKLKQNHISIPSMVQMLKGYTSYVLRRKYLWMKNYKALWSPGYFLETVGNMSEKTIKKYIDNQRTQLKPTYRYRQLVEDLNRQSFSYHGLKHEVFSDSTKSSKTSQKTISDKGHDGIQQRHLQFSNIFSTQMP